MKTKQILAEAGFLGFLKIAESRHLNMNKMLKATFQGCRDHSNKQKDKQRFYNTKNKKQ